MQLYSWQSACGTNQLLSARRFSVASPLESAVTLGPKDTVKVVLTAKEGEKAKRPHQAFLVVKEPESGLEAPFPLKLKESGKGVVEIVRSFFPNHSPLPLYNEHVA